MLLLNLAIYVQVTDDHSVQYLWTDTKNEQLRQHNSDRKIIEILKHTVS
jgi:hypothetical protein